MTVGGLVQAWGSNLSLYNHEMFLYDHEEPTNFTRCLIWIVTVTLHSLEMRSIVFKLEFNIVRFDLKYDCPKMKFLFSRINAKKDL